MKEEKEICDMILATIGNIRNAENVGIAVSDKYGNNNKELIFKLCEIAGYIQSLSRGWISQQQRADDCYAEKRNQKKQPTGKIGG